jgi:predicted SprT family Zn-dependent metalloprotease
MRIPKRFKLLGRTIEVVDNPQLLQDRTWSGAADYNRDEIQLLPRSDAYVASKGKIEQTFCHELSHFLTYHSGCAVNHQLKDGGYIHQNEEFVDLLGSLIHQFLTTAEYE